MNVTVRLSKTTHIVATVWLYLDAWGAQNALTGAYHRARSREFVMRGSTIWLCLPTFYSCVYCTYILATRLGLPPQWDYCVVTVLNFTNRVPNSLWSSKLTFFRPGWNSFAHRLLLQTSTQDVLMTTCHVWFLEISISARKMREVAPQRKNIQGRRKCQELVMA
jgi:hypothetical protein